MKLELLKGVPIFKGLPEETLKFIIDVSEVRKFEDNEVIVEEGSRGGELFVILSGTVKIYVKVEEDQEKFNLEVFEMGQGEFFGEYSMLMGQPRSATVKAKGDAEILVISKDVIKELENDCLTGLRLYKNIAKILSRRIISSDKKVKKWFKSIL